MCNCNVYFENRKKTTNFAQMKMVPIRTVMKVMMNTTAKKIIHIVVKVTMIIHTAVKKMFIQMEVTKIMDMNIQRRKSQRKTRFQILEMVHTFADSIFGEVMEIVMMKTILQIADLMVVIVAQIQDTGTVKNANVKESGLDQVQVLNRAQIGLCLNTMITYYQQSREVQNLAYQAQHKALALQELKLHPQVETAV